MSRINCPNCKQDTDIGTNLNTGKSTCMNCNHVFEIVYKSELVEGFGCDVVYVDDTGEKK